MTPRRSEGQGYGRLATVYDSWQRGYGRGYSRRIYPELLAILKRYRCQPGTLVDLGCGTGSLAFLFEQSGWRVLGVDVSAGMIACASRKASESGSSVRFSVQDIRSFSTGVRCDVAVSVYDVLNHLLTERDLSECFRAVRENLADDGLFVFDVNNDRCYRRLWRGNQELQLREFSMLFENSYDRRRGIATSMVTVTYVENEEEFLEKVMERYYPRRTIHKALAEAGFKVVECTDFGFPNLLEAGLLKTWWVAVPA